MKKMSFSAVTLSWIFIGLISLTLVGTGFGCWYLQKLLAAERISADHAKIDASISASELQKAHNLQIYLSNNKEHIEKAAAVVAETKTYQYQNQIVADVNQFASIAGVTVLGFDFPVQTTAKPAAKGVKTIQATVTLQNPVPYENYLRFLKLIEQNLTKMQITDISITPDEKVIGRINNPTVGLQVYVR
jgi:hypothetical protein